MIEKIQSTVPTATIAVAVFLAGLSPGTAPAGAQDQTWAEKLGYPSDAKVLILHADDLGMAWEANEAAAAYFHDDRIQSGAIMAPCPWFGDAVELANNTPGADLGLHLTLNSEWQTYRWTSISRGFLSGLLLDSEGYLHGALQDLLLTPGKSVEEEIEAQLERAQKAGFTPTHLDTHMGALYLRKSFFKAYLELSRKTGIPAMTFANVEETINCFPADEGEVRRADMEYPGLLEALLEGWLEDVTDFEKLLEDYPFPRLDMFCSVPRGDTYEEKRENFLRRLRGLPPGITEFYFHPMVDTPGTRRITNKWRQRVWEGRLFSDSRVIEFFADPENKIVFTDWIEMMRRYEESFGSDGGSPNPVQQQTTSPPSLPD